MALDVLDMVPVIETMENYIEKVRPPVEIRPTLDIGYRIENQSVILFEIRPQWNDATVIRHYDYAKTTFDKKNNYWKIYWKRADMKWHLYKTAAPVKNLAGFLKEVDADPHGCFKG